MKDIKFRAWDKINNRMLNVARIDIADGSIKEFIFAGDFLDYWNNCVLMQSIGLNDMKGNPIFKGDIVKHECRNYPNANPSNDLSIEDLKRDYIYDEEVDDYYEIDELYMEVTFDIDSQITKLVDIYTKDTYSFLYDFEASDLEVIGNIFESKYLMEVEDVNKKL